jgi:hypothetical protein
MNSNPQYRLSGLQNGRFNPPDYRAFVGFETLMITRIGLKTREIECSWLTGLAPPPTIYPTLLAAPNAGGYFLLRAVALLIRVAALLASASFSKPNRRVSSAHYLRHHEAHVDLRIADRLAIAWPTPGRLSPSTSRVEMDEGARPIACAAAAGFLPETAAA